MWFFAFHKNDMNNDIFNNCESKNCESCSDKSCKEAQRMLKKIYELEEQVKTLKKIIQSLNEHFSKNDYCDDLY